MTTGRINQVAFLRDVGTAWHSTRRRIGGEAKTVHEHRACRETKCLKGTDGSLDPTPTKHSASESTVEHLSSNAVTKGTLGTQGTTEVHPAATKGARRNTYGGTSNYHHERYATQDPDFPPLRLPHGERMKRSAVRQFDATSTEPADTHNHFTTHMPVAHARQHRSTSNHDPQDRVNGR